VEKEKQWLVRNGKVEIAKKNNQILVCIFCVLYYTRMVLVLGVQQAMGADARQAMDAGVLGIDMGVYCIDTALALAALAWGNNTLPHIFRSTHNNSYYL